jgi:hypothetical protein
MRVLVYLALLIPLLPVSAFAQKNWPLMQPAQKIEKISLPNIDDPDHLKETGFNSTFDLAIRSAQGDTLYKIECGNPDRSDAKVFEYSGDFQCRLIVAREEVTPVDLLSEVSHSTHDWQSRARFFASEVLGQCGEVADYGRVRKFRLRGMQITLSMSDIKANKSGRVPTLQEFTFRADVVPDGSAKSQVAEAPHPSLRSELPGCPLDNSVPVHFLK